MSTTPSASASASDAASAAEDTSAPSAAGPAGTKSSVTKKSVVAKAVDRQLPGFEENDSNTKWKDDFYFVQAADPQLGLIANYGDGTIDDQYPNVTWEKEVELCNQSVKILNALRPKPEFLIVCGDMLDAWPEKWPDIRAKQEKDFMTIYSELDSDIPMVCVCGNHDVGNTPTVETVASYRSSFGDDFFSFWVNGVCFIVINSQYYEDHSMVPEIARAQDEWLDKTLARARELKAAHTVVFQHIPWFVEKPDEKKIYFNMNLDIRKKMLRKFHDAGVRYIFCGHYHRNAGGMFEDLELVVTTAIGCQIGPDTHGMRLVTVREKKIEHKFHSLKEFPEKIIL